MKASKCLIVEAENSYESELLHKLKLKLVNEELSENGYSRYFCNGETLELINRKLKERSNE